MLTSPAKFSKCLSMVYQLIKESFDFLTTEITEDDEVISNGDVLFNAFDAIMRCPNKFE